MLCDIILFVYPNTMQIGKNTDVAINSLVVSSIKHCPCSPGHSQNMPNRSNGFNSVSHPAFGLYTSSSGRSEFGGLGSLGLSALAAQSQFGTFPSKFINVDKCSSLSRMYFEIHSIQFSE